MTGKYEVLLGDEAVGVATVSKKGLYYMINCRCKLSGEVIYRLVVSGDGWQEDLGVFIPCGQSFCVDTSIPSKRIGEGNTVFRAVPRRLNGQGRFVSVMPEEPFSYIRELGQAVLEIKNGKVGIRFP